MGFFGHIQRTNFGISVPTIIAPNYDDPNTLANLFKTHGERAMWSRIDWPEHGCAVIVHNPLHIGTWLDMDGGGVLHCVKGVGVVYTHGAAWPSSGFGRREYFRHIEVS